MGREITCLDWKVREGGEAGHLYRLGGEGRRGGRSFIQAVISRCRLLLRALRWAGEASHLNRLGG